MFSVRQELLTYGGKPDGLEHGFVGEASSISLPPGEWPDVIRLIGAGAASDRVVWRSAAGVDDGEITWVEYRSRSGSPTIMVRIYND